MRIIDTKSDLTEEGKQKHIEIKGKIRVKKNKRALMLKIAIVVGIADFIVTSLLLLQMMGVLQPWLQKIL